MISHVLPITCIAPQHIKDLNDVKAVIVFLNQVIGINYQPGSSWDAYTVSGTRELVFDAYQAKAGRTIEERMKNVCASLNVVLAEVVADCTLSATPLQLQNTERGFSRAEFTDSYGEQCSIQKSSAASDDFIWLGMQPKQITVFEPNSPGRYVTTPMPENWQVSSRMHLDRETVASMLPLLQSFVETGELS